MQPKAQSLLEFSVVICVVVAAIFGMQAYFVRSMQGRIKGLADEISGGMGYSPKAMTSYSESEREVREASASVSVRIDDQVKGSLSSSKMESRQSLGRNENILPLKAEPER